jgi:ubiquinone/menaquinone biosynthesis C-methylase UbiE
VNLAVEFDDYAQNWDTDKRIKRAKIIAEEISNAIADKEKYSAMEFGCGTGLISFNLQDKFKTITLVDSSKGMIKVLNSKIDKYKINNMIPYHIDISNENLADMKFDVIYNSMVLHHIHDTKAIIKTFYELLNRDGYLCIVDLDEEDGSFHRKYPDFDGHNGFKHSELTNVLVEVGFKDIEINTFFYDEKTIDDEKIKYSLFLLKGRK